MKGSVMCTCGSMKPGNTNLPAASTTWAPGGASRPGPIRVIVSPSQKMSARERESAVTISPFLIRSAIAGSLPPDVVHRAAEPPRGDRLLLGVELHGFAALDVEVPVEGLVPAGEREHGHRGRHPHVDPDHAGLDAVLELPRRPAGRGEDRRPVAIGRLVGRLDRL